MNTFCPRPIKMYARFGLEPMKTSIMTARIQVSTKNSALAEDILERTGELLSYGDDF